MWLTLNDLLRLHSQPQKCGNKVLLLLWISERFGESKGRKVQHFEATGLDDHSRSCVSTFFSSCLTAKKRDWQGIFAIEVKNKWDKLRISEALKGTFEHMEIQKLCNNTKNSLHLVEHLFLNGYLVCFACQLGSRTHRNGFA